MITPTDPAPSAAEVKERLKELNEIVGDYDFRMSYGTEHGQTIASAIALIERGELERERLDADLTLHKQLLSQRDSENADTLIEAVKIERERNALRKQLAAATGRVKLWQSLAEEGAILAVRYGVSIEQEPFAEDLKKRVELAARAPKEGTP